MRKCAISSIQASSERGVALILTLSILALVTLLAIAFAVSMRTENSASKNYNDLIKARELAQGAVDQAVALIHDATPPLTPTSTYVTSPGTIYTLSAGTWLTTPLFTAGTDVDLNKTNRITGTSTVYSNGTQILVGWTNTVVDGKLLGRSAFWVDDESVKANLNVAQTRGNDLDGQTPAAIDLQQFFTATDVGFITNYASTHSFDTPETVEIPIPAVGGVGKYTTNQFYLTVNSSSPDLTPWGTKRLNVVAIATNASLTADQKVMAIANALSDANLNTWFGMNYSSKYPSVQQIAANIVDYIDSDDTPTDSGVATDLTTPAYLGLEQTPYINEFQFSNRFDVVYTPTSAVVTLDSVTQIELWYMYANGTGWTNSAGSETVVMGRPDISITPAANVDGTPGWIPTNPAPFAVTNNMGPNTYQVYSVNDGPFTFTITGFPTVINFSGGVVTAILRTATSRIDYQLIPVNATSFTISALGSPVAGTFFRTRDAGANDPRARPSDTNNPSYWNALTSGSAGSIGQRNNAPFVLNVISGVTTNPLAPTIGIRADGDVSCHTNITILRDRGTMYPGELGYIHTGVPWHTFWLQPQYPTEVGSIPDWAVLDLFSASDTSNPTGRMNINAWITPYNGGGVPQRLAPLSALLTNGLAPSTLYNETNVALNIYDPIVDLTNVVIRFPAFTSNAFAFAGEVCEIQGLATNALNIAVGFNIRNKARAEAPVRGIANLIIPRSDTFTIWTLAQSIKDVNANGTYESGTDIITGEAKVQAIVQRYEQGGAVKFRTLYYRYIYE